MYTTLLVSLCFHIRIFGDCLLKKNNKFLYNKYKNTFYFVCLSFCQNDFHVRAATDLFKSTLFFFFVVVFFPAKISLWTAYRGLQAIEM